MSAGAPHRWYLANVARGINPQGPHRADRLFGANAAMIRFGLLQERINLARDEVDWRPFLYGCAIGAVPWIAITAQLAVSSTALAGG